MSKNSLKFLFVLIMVLCTAFSLVACNKTFNQFDYSIENETVTIKSYTDNSLVPTIVIPDVIDNLPVTTIGDFGISNTTYAKSITISKNVKEISPMAFTANEGVSEYIVDSENEFFVSVDGVLFTKDMTELIAYPLNKSNKSYTVPDGVETIRPYAFYHAKNLTDITLSNTVKTIGEFCFFRIDNLTNVQLSTSLETIGNDAFSNDAKLTEITIYSSIKEIGSYAFYNCTLLHTVNINKAEKDIVLGKKWYPTDLGRKINTLVINYAN